jgi:tight adherence protein C
VPPLVAVAIVAIALALALVAWAALASSGGARSEVLSNALQGLDTTDEPEPTRSALSRVVRGVLPARFATRIESKIARAGFPEAWTVERVVLMKLGLPVLTALLGWWFVSGDPSQSRYLVSGLVLVVSFFLPELLLLSRIQERQQLIAAALPDTLDQMTIGVEAGLGFEAAMMRAARNGKGPLAEELTRTLNDMQLGHSRRTAYLALAERVDVSDLRRFLRAVIQADAYGIAVADVLRTQAAEMRLKRRQSAEEKAMKIPVKVLFPLMTCILPALFVVLIGPAALDIMKAFS